MLSIGLVVFAFLRFCDAELWIWNSTKQDFVVRHDLLKNVLTKTTNFHKMYINATIQVLTFDMAPYVIIENNTGKLTGFLGDIWNIVEEFLKFRSNITQVKTFAFGIDQLIQNKADAYLSAIVYTNQTKPLVLSNPYFLNWYNLYFKLPDGKPADYLHFRTFTSSLWIHIVSVFFLLTFMLWISCLILRKVMTRLETIYSLPTFFMGIISAFFSAGYDLKLRCYSTRLQIFTAQFFGILCCYALSASLVASLAVLHHPQPFTGLDDFPKQSTYSLCLRNITFVYDSLTDENRTLLPQWRGKVNTINKCPQKLYDPNATINRDLCENKVAFLESKIMVGQILKPGVACKLTVLSQRYFTTGNHIAFSKQFYKEPIAIMLMRIRSTGISYRIEHHWVLNPIPDYSFTTALNQITYSHIKGLIFIYLFLIGISLIILSIEILIDKYLVYENEDKVPFCYIK